ncbi:YNL234W [Saccharomyces arboricola H-6]|uniref:YNL234W n=1 Tax=Saccharomyces arboricola (strain H-6 / AS 2.3317 / CBS 10644) TaxID=1160507 RepID=J8PXL5_SACAR|nr:YNL234W [Saccharomyces arboricola H-6]
MTDDKGSNLQLISNKGMHSEKPLSTVTTISDTSLPYYNSSSGGHRDSLKNNEEAASRNYSMKNEISSKNSGSEFMPQSILYREDGVCQVKKERPGSVDTEEFDFKINDRDLVLLRMSWNILLKEYLTPEELKVFQTLLYSNTNFTPTERPYLNTGFEGMISKTLAPCIRPSKNKKKEVSKVDTALFCTQFYDNLIAMDPLLEENFPSLRHQAVSFCKVLDSAIDNLENVHVLDDYIVKLGKRHSRILGIRKVGFEIMGNAFITTLQDRFGSFFTLELKNLWGQLYSYLANCMITAGKDPAERTKSGAPNQQGVAVLSFPVPNIVTHDINKLQLVKTKNATKPKTLALAPTDKSRSEILVELSDTQTKSDRTSTPPISPEDSSNTQPSVVNSAVMRSSSKKRNYDETIHALQRTAQQKNCSIM